MIDEKKQKSKNTDDQGEEEISGSSHSSHEGHWEGSIPSIDRL